LNKDKTKKLVFTSSLLDIQHSWDSVAIKPTSQFIASLGKALKSKLLPFSVWTSNRWQL